MSSANSGAELDAAVLSQFAVEATSGARERVRAAFAGVKVTVAHKGDTVAATNSSYCVDNDVECGFRVTSCTFVPSAALTSDNTNYATLQLVSNNGNGGADTVIATCNTKNSAGGGTGSWVADIGEALTITAADAAVAEGSQVQLRVLKIASGVNVPAGSFVLKGRWE
jgi:hypothetical protein